MRVVNEEACDKLNASLRHIAVHVSGVVEADVRRVWEAVREFGAVSKWLPAAEASVLKVLLLICRLCGFTERLPPVTSCRHRAALLVSLKLGNQADCFSPYLLFLWLPCKGLLASSLCAGALMSAVQASVVV